MFQNCRQKVNAIAFLGNQRRGGEGARKPTRKYLYQVRAAFLSNTIYNSDPGKEPSCLQMLRSWKEVGDNSLNPRGVRAARTYECLSTHETLTTINAFGARVKWLFYRLIVKPRGSDMQQHVVGCEPRQNDRNISTRHIATLLRINELNSTFLKFNI